MIFVMFFYMYLSFKIQRYYMKLVRELTRLNAISSSPIIQNFKENLEGVSSIRFHEKRAIQFNRYNNKVDEYQKNLIALKGALAWFNIRVGLLSLLVIIPTIIISVCFLSSKINFLVVCCESPCGGFRSDAQFFTANN